MVLPVDTLIGLLRQRLLLTVLRVDGGAFFFLQWLPVQGGASVCMFLVPAGPASSPVWTHVCSLSVSCFPIPWPVGHVVPGS